MCGHLFLGCVLTKQVWFAMLQPLQLSSLMPEGGGDIGEWWLQQCRRVDNAS
jgi:hypothetical protein